MRPISVTLQNLIDDADGAFLAQTLAGALPVNLNGALVVNGDVIFTPAQKLSVVSVGDDSGINLNIDGLDTDGQALSEVLPLTNASTATSANFYSKIFPTTATSGATAGDITGGTLSADGAMSKTIVMNYKQKGNFNIGLQMILSGTINSTLRYTVENPFEPRPNGFAMNAVWNDVTGLAGITASADSNVVISIFALQMIVNSASADGVSKMVGDQGG